LQKSNLNSLGRDYISQESISAALQKAVTSKNPYSAI